MCRLKKNSTFSSEANCSFKRLLIIAWRPLKSVVFLFLRYCDATQKMPMIHLRRPAKVWIQTIIEGSSTIHALYFSSLGQPTAPKLKRNNNKASNSPVYNEIKRFNKPFVFDTFVFPHTYLNYCKNSDDESGFKKRIKRRIFKLYWKVKLKYNNIRILKSRRKDKVLKNSVIVIAMKSHCKKIARSANEWDWLRGEKFFEALSVVSLASSQ